MNRFPLRLSLKFLLCLLIAGGAYFWAIGLMDSTYAYRSPLDDTPPAAGADLGEPATRRVVWVLIDGLRTDTAADSIIMPVLNRLRAEGASATMHSRTPSYSAPGYSTLVTGAWQEINSGPAFNLDYEDIPPLTQDTIFAAVQRAGMRTGISAYNWFEKLLAGSPPDESFYTAGDDRIADAEVMAAALPMLAGDASLVLIHLDQVDYAGHHEGGGDSAGWDAAASRTDALLGEIAARLDPAQDTLLVLSDHGHVDRGGHGGGEMVVLTEPLILHGAGVKPGVYEDCRMVDVAPTIAALLGTSLPASSQGAPLVEMLDLPAGTLADLPAIRSSQQIALASAYANAMGNPPGLDEYRMLEDAGQVMDSLRSARLNADRLWRIPLAVLVWAVLAFAWQRTRLSPAARLLMGAAAAILVFHLGHLLSGRVYSYSSVDSVTGLIVFGAVSTGAGMLAAWLGLNIFQRRFSQPPGRAAEFALDLALLTVLILLLVPLAFSALYGPLVTWFLPDLGMHYLALISLLEILMTAAMGVLLAGVGALVARLARGRQG